MKSVEINGKTVYVEPLKFKDFLKFTELLLMISEDAEKDNLRPSEYLSKAIPLMSSMSGLPTEEIENLPAKEALKLLNACIETILEDKDFFKEINKMLQRIAESLSSQQRKN